MRISHKRLTIWKATFAVLLPINGHKCWEKSSKIGHPDWTTSEPAVADLCQKSYLKCSLGQHGEHGFAASKATDVDVVGDEIENNSTNSQTLVVENQHINPPEEPEYMANADYDALKKHRRGARESEKGVKKTLSSCRPKSIKSRPNSPVASPSKEGVIICPACEEKYCDPSTDEWIQCCKCQEWWHEESSNYENGIFIRDYC
ncbi:uncharacterized protein TNCV_2044291 [Trichonephila clavipes]|nr:uncharacterized protein TNCV_2044291 [Trichonephila clavipes]